MIELKVYEGNPHWEAFHPLCSVDYRNCKYNWVEYIQLLDAVLKEYKGFLKFHDNDTDSGIKSIVFETEEDLIVFKLKFN